MYLNKRLEELLKMLVDKDYLSIGEISKKLNIFIISNYCLFFLIIHFLHLLLSEQLLLDFQLTQMLFVAYFIISYIIK